MTKRRISLFKTSLIYAIGQVLSQILNFFLLPVYTNRLGTIEYGKYATITAFTGFISTFLILSIYSGFYRFYKEFQNDSNKQNQMINTAINFSYIMSFVIIILLFIVGKSVQQYIFNFEHGYKILWIIIITSIVSQISSIYTSKYSLEYKAFKVSIINIIKLIIQFIIIIFLVVFKNMGLMGVLYGQLMANIGVYLYLLISEIKNYKLEFCKEMFRNMIIFSAGLLPVNISGWILQLSDRYFLNNYKGFESTGIYNLSYQFGMIINPVFITPFLGSFTPYVMETYKNKDAKENFKNLMRQYNVIGCFIMLGISVFSKTGIYLFANKNFISAYLVVPMIVYSYFLYGKVFYYALGLQIKNKTYIEGIYMIVCALINIGINFAIIPKMGMVGAAISTVISYLALNFILIIVSQKEYPIDLDIKFTLGIQLLTLCFYLIYLLYSHLNVSILIEILLNVIIMTLYLVSIDKLGFYKLKEILLKLKKKKQYYKSK